MRKSKVPRVAAVIASVFMAFFIVALFGVVLVFQVSELAQNVTTYQSNILTKVRSLKEGFLDFTGSMKAVVSYPDCQLSCGTRPERAIMADPDLWYPATPAQMGEDTYADFHAATRDPETIHGMLEDYRAGVGI